MKTRYSSFGLSYYIKKNFFLDAKKNNILNKTFKYNKKLILIHGLKDKVVSSSVPNKILNRVTTKNAKIIFLKNSDHRLSNINDLKTIKLAIDSIRKN